MGASQDRLRAVEARLASISARALYPDDTIETMTDDEAEAAARAELGRLTQLARLEAEVNHTPARRNRRPPPEQGRLF